MFTSYDNLKILAGRVISILAGAFVFACSINTLFIPHKLFGGGLVGLAMVPQYLFGFPTAVTILFLNIPLFIGGYKYVSRRFAWLSALGMGGMAFFLFLTSGWIIPVEDPVIAAVFGGLIAGLGAGIVLKNRGSLGGADIIAVIVNKYFSFSIGTVSLLVSFVVLVIAALVFNVETAMYTMIAIFVSNKTLDAVQEGVNQTKTIIIVSDRSQEMAAELLTNTKRGITFLQGEGAYTAKEKNLIYMVVRTMELSGVMDIVKKTDPQAFMSIIDTKQVVGKGFDIVDLF